MQWTAYRCDGFTSRLLRYTVQVQDGVAELDADWFSPGRPTDGFRARFAIADEPVKRLIPELRIMREQYRTDWTDQDDKRLEVEVDGERIRRDVYGGRDLISAHPELRPFLDLFDLLERQVLAQLPYSSSEPD